MNAWLVRYYAEHVWKLQAPEVLISITSGLTSDYNLEASIEDQLLYDMMDMTNNFKAWLITNGASQGFAKRVGHYRNKYAVTTPLIGIACVDQPASSTFARANGKPAPASASESPAGSSSGAWRPSWIDYVDAQLDQNHSHFILATNTSTGGKQHSKLRSDFEACIRQNGLWAEMKKYMDNSLKETDTDWQQEDDGFLNDTQATAHEYTKSSDIPVANVSVQGGHESIRTILNSVNEMLPVLLVRGTGKATDLVADCVCLKFPQGHAKRLERTRLSPKQKVLAFSRSLSRSIARALLRSFARSLSRSLAHSHSLSLLTLPLSLPPPPPLSHHTRTPTCGACSNRCSSTT
jgi:hypothetical protein